MFSLKLVIFVLFYSKINPIKCAVKTWIPNLNFNNAQNWLGNKVPGVGNDLVFPSNFFALTTLPKRDIGNLILPREGGLILPENSEIRLIDTQHRQSYFKSPAREPWFLSKNWRNLNPENNQIDDFNPATPHQEMIPCQMDSINFAAENNFRADLQFISKIMFRGITLHGQQMYQHKFKDFLSTELGQYMFLNSDETSIEQGKCSEPENDECLCQESSVIDVLCENERNNCDLPRCLEPIQPIGHCCKICGGLAQIEYLVGFNVSLGKLKEKIDKQIRMSEYNRADVQYHVSVVRDSILKKRWIQLVIVDKHEYQEISTNLLALLKKTLLQQIYRDSQQKIFMSGRRYQPLQHGHGLLFAFCTLLSVTMFLTLVHAFYYDNKYIPQLSAMIRMRRFFTTPNIFARFENHPDLDDCNENGDVSESVVVNVEFARDNSDNQKQRNSSFNNPMFEDVLERAEKTAERRETSIREKPYMDIELPLHSNEE